MRASAGLVIVSVFVLGAILGPLATPHSPHDHNLAERNTPPFWQEGGTSSHPLGTDHFGRDVLSRLAHGARTSLIVGLSAFAISGSILITLGFLFSYYRGPWDNLYDLNLPLPIRLVLPVVWLVGCLFLAVALISSIGIGLVNLIVVVGLATSLRHIGAFRSSTMRLLSGDTIIQAGEGGSPDFRIIARLLFPKIAGVLPGLLVLQLGLVMAVEFLLTFLGIGVPPHTPAWGERQHIMSPLVGGVGRLRSRLSFCWLQGFICWEAGSLNAPKSRRLDFYSPGAPCA